MACHTLTRIAGRCSTMPTDGRESCFGVTYASRVLLSKTGSLLIAAGYHSSLADVVLAPLCPFQGRPRTGTPPGVPVLPTMKRELSEPSGAQVPGDRAGAVAHRGDQLRTQLALPAQPLHRARDADRAHRHPAPVVHGRGDRGHALPGLLHVGRVTPRPRDVEDVLELAGVAHRAVRERLAFGLQGLAVRHRVVRGQHLAQRGAVQRLHGADLQHLPAVVGPEDVVHDQHALLVQHPQVHALPAGAGQIVRPHQGARPQLVHVQIGGAQAQQLGAQLIAARGVVLLHEPLLLEGAQDAVRGALGEAERGGDVRQAEPPLAAREQPQHRGRAFERLDVPCHRRPASVPFDCRYMPVGEHRLSPHSLPPFGNVEHYRSMSTSR
ncbi:hypothetical protein SGPA1_20163 [Streptomyces misionensis JCM 4497]